MTQVTSPPRQLPGGRPVPGPPGLPDRRSDGRPAAAGPGSSPSGLQLQRRASLSTVFEGTPGRLRLMGVAAVLSCLALSLLGFSAFSARAGALADARSDAAQLIRVQQIATKLVEADSLFTNGNLAYGLESTSNLAAYDSAIREASNLVAEAAQAKPADAAALAEVNEQLTEYTARVASARANNVHAYQVATGYLRQANVLLRGDGDTGKVKGMLPTLQTLMATSDGRVDDAYDRSRLATWLLAGAVLLTLGGLVAVQVRLARRTHRYLNIPLAGASVVALLVLGVGSVVMVSAQANANDVRDTSYRALQNVARARIAAYTAKSAESISLIYLGTGGNYAAAQQQFEQSTQDAAARLKEVPGAASGGVGASELAAWKAKHGEIYKKASTSWQAAAKEATKDAAAGSVTLNSTFAALEKVTSDALDTQARSVDSGLLSGRVPLTALSWVAIVAGLLAAVAAWAGIAQRLEEYR